MNITIRENIFPYSKENVDAIIEYYFFRKGMSFVPGDLEFIQKNSGNLQINELAFISECISNNLDFFKNELSINSLSIANLLKYGIDAYKSIFNNGSTKRNSITRKFHNIMFR
jgi:hypothetical protein